MGGELRDRVRVFFGKLQNEICLALEQLDGRATFREDAWSYAPGEGPGEGGGRSRIIENGAVFEKGGVNFAEVRGTLNERLAARLNVEPQPFHATGVSLVLHPESPKIPTTHMNVRYLELPTKRWFGGGADLTPYYLIEEDTARFHRCLKEACDRHDPAYYPRFKQQCDRYFHLKHRGEARGVGGLFFDYLDDDPEGTFAFVQDVGRTFLPAYVPIVGNHAEEAWSEAEKQWQLIRRGRYVEFNLVYDRGTLFGLETGGRTESILMSLPPAVRWAYDHRPEAGSAEERLLEVLREPRDWV